MSFHVRLGASQRASFGEVSGHGESVHIKCRNVAMDTVDSSSGTWSDGGPTCEVVGGFIVKITINVDQP
jgi:hypothetical protein